MLHRPPFFSHARWDGVLTATTAAGAASTTATGAAPTSGAGSGVVCAMSSAGAAPSDLGASVGLTVGVPPGTAGASSEVTSIASPMIGFPGGASAAVSCPPGRASWHPPSASRTDSISKRRIRGPQDLQTGGLTWPDPAARCKPRPPRGPSRGPDTPGAPPRYRPWPPATTQCPSPRCLPQAAPDCWPR